MSARPETCRTCDAPVLWRMHETTGRWAPIDAEPNPAGPLVLLDERLYAHAGPPSLLDQRERFMPHYSTCPDAAAWRDRARAR